MAVFDDPSLALFQGQGTLAQKMWLSGLLVFIGNFIGIACSDEAKTGSLTSPRGILDC